jgi:hypothetical protein
MLDFAEVPYQQEKQPDLCLEHSCSQGKSAKSSGAGGSASREALQFAIELL